MHGGLYGRKWENEGQRVVHLGARGSGAECRDITFSRQGTLYGIGNGLCQIDPTYGEVKFLTETPTTMSSFIWEPIGSHNNVLQCKCKK